MRRSRRRTVVGAVVLACSAVWSLACAGTARATEAGGSSGSLFWDPGGSVVFSGHPPRIPFSMAAVPSTAFVLEGGEGAESGDRAVGSEVPESSPFAGDAATAAPSPQSPVTALPGAAGDRGSRGAARNPCTRELAGDYLCYRCGSVLYQPVYYGGRLVYRIVDE